MYVAQGMVNHSLETLFTGWLFAAYLNQALMMATDRRFILIHCAQNGKPSHFASEIPYQAITKLKPGGGLSTFTIGWKKGNAVISNISKRDGKRFLAYREEALTWHVQSTAERSVEHQNYLCPSCYMPITSMVDACPRCRKYFRTARSAALRSLALPGLGDLYLGNSFFAVLKLFGSAIILLMVLSSIFTSKSPEELVGAVIGGLILVGFYNGLNALVTLSIAKKGIIAEDARLAQRE